MLSRDSTHFSKLRRNPSKCVKYKLKNNSSATRNPEVKQFCIIAVSDDEFRWKLASDSVDLILWWAACVSLHSNGRYGSALTRVSGRKNRNNQVIMADACSLSKKGFLDCGSSRGRTETVFLYECRDDVTTRLKNYFLSRVADLSVLFHYNIGRQKLTLRVSGLLKQIWPFLTRKLRACARASYRYDVGNGIRSLDWSIPVNFF